MITARRRVRSRGSAALRHGLARDVDPSAVAAVGNRKRAAEPRFRRPREAFDQVLATIDQTVNVKWKWSPVFPSPLPSSRLLVTSRTPPAKIDAFHGPAFSAVRNLIVATFVALS